MQMCCDHYAFRAYLETILNFSRDFAETKLHTNVFAKDTAGKFDKTDSTNTG